MEAGANVVVHSLAISPIEKISKVATLSFHTLPNCLSDCSRNEWVFNLPADETSEEDGFSRRKSLVFDTHFSGFTPLQHTKNDDCYVDVIAISGLGGHAFGSFKERHGSFMWLRDALPIDVPGARILIYGYDTRLIRSRSFQNLTDLGKALQIDIKGVRELTQTRPTVFIGHSLGGLVIKEAIVKLKEELDEKDASILKSTSGFLFFGVPHQGMAIESLVPLVKDNPNRSLLESLNKNSALLQRLEKDFSNVFGTKRLRIVSFYETENSPTAVEMEDGKWELSGDPKVLVDVSSATCGTPTQLSDENIGLDEQITRSFLGQRNPGAGKSVLMKYAVTMMHSRKSRELVVSFFIHGRGTPLQKNLLGLFRALLNSMLISFPEYLSQLTKRFHDQERRFGTYQENRWAWTKEELQDFMSEVLTKGTRNRPVVIFVDAIDECGEFHAKHLLEYFKSLMNKVEREEAQMEKEILLKAQGGFQWVVLITSMVIDGNTIGIKAEKLHEMITTTPEALDELYSNILSGVTGAENHQMTKLFQWVLFAERPLSAQELREALATDKDMTYTTVSELRNHDSWSDTLEDFEKHVRHISRGLVEFRTRDLWEQYEPGGEDWDREVQFVHQSVADYILEKFLNHVRLGDASQSQIGTGHFEISRSCLRYMALREVLEGAQLSRGTFSARFPLVPYAVRFLFHHIREVEREGISQHDLLQLIQWDRQSEFMRKIASIWRVMDPNNAHSPTGWPFIGATPLHVLVALGSKSAFDALLQKDDVEVDGRDSDGNTPLLLALRDCHQNMALTLLNRSTEWQQPRNEAINQGIIQDKDTDDRSNHFVDINAENNDGETPLMIALTVDAEEVIWKLIEAGADLFKQQTWLIFYAIGFNKSFEDKDEDERDDEALLLASRRGQTAIVNLLLSHGISATWRDKHGDFPLLVAAENGYETIVKLLLENGGDVDAKDTLNYGYASLMRALQNGHEAVARFLIDKGAGVNVSDINGLSLLSWTVLRDFETVVKFLITNKANINVTDKDGASLLLWALQSGREAVASLLIRNGANISASDKDGLTPLLWASRKGYEEVVRLLIYNGADINASGKDGSTPLSWASQNGHVAIVELLIHTGADIHASDKDGITSLSWAVRNDFYGVAWHLVNSGANVNASDKNGLTPLSWASQNGSKEIAMLLRRNNRGPFLE
ncbi:ankyrin repeats (3 copies) domain-containing protein [Trichoderma breve]|uniref:Ankyrin repeats (3 copies) domain-containing protein n=1 Tax=Trichoderma breve TaxID=2034170 RepID=A0A9W9E2B3_9HYPO|nr:ankyrin repeats (3 copies) domain-containing protein [Trichoderma breve]KAJ4856068.1 ankyrin repeats (3 copies) domain-containing protein [Trichoderma breve]